MGLMTVFFQDNAIRTARLGVDIWWMGRDVAACLGYSDAPSAIQDHCLNARTLDEIDKSRVSETLTPNDDKVGETPTLGVHPHSKFIPLGDVLRLVVRSKLPSAQVFERWVFEEVLPSILRTGRYAFDPEPDFEIMREKMAVIRETRLTHGRAAAQAMWRELGLPLPPSEEDRQVAHASEAQRQIYGYIHDFLEECCEPAPTSRVRTPELHKLYNDWAVAGGAPFITLTAFGLSMRHSPYRKMKAGTTWWLGLRIRDDARRRIAEKRR